jgi:serine/threonine-protein kinase
MTDRPNRPSEGDKPAKETGDSATLPASSEEKIGDGATLPAPSGQISEDATLPAPSGQVGEDDTLEPDKVTTSTPSLVGQSLAGRYAVLELIGKGGMSVVYRARHELLKKVVAIKVLKEALAANKESLTRFHREAMAAANIGDPHIVDITDYGFTERGDAFIVMEALEGQDLRALVNEEGALEPGRAVAIARQILRALSAAHDRGIIHRDLKAENVFICQRERRDFVKLLDFGISKVLEPLDDTDQTGLTSTGAVMGTPQYLAPEQAQGMESVDHRVDIYAMGVILYEMITGGLPFTGKSVFDLVMKHVQQEPEPPSKRRPDLEIPRELEQVVLKAMSKKPEDRFPTAKQMLAALPGSDSLPGGFPSGTLTDATARPGRRVSPVTMLGIVMLLVVIAGGVAMYKLYRRDTVSNLLKQAIPTDLAVVRPDSSLSATQAPQDARPADLVATIKLTVTATPKHAEIFLDGKLEGSEKVTVTLPKGEIHEVRVTAPGHRPYDKQIRFKADRDLEVTLRRRGRVTPAKKTKTHKGSKEIEDNPYR